MCHGGKTNDSLESSVIPYLSIIFFMRSSPLTWFPTFAIMLMLNRTYRKQCQAPLKWRLGQLWRFMGLQGWYVLLHFEPTLYYLTWEIIQVLKTISSFEMQSRA